uniref:lytic transglycosylase domain-containing protein n=1 Tax=Propionispora hippei TaxID=209080 RepID=UPI001CB6BC70|nr:lytic transglycosylase domain-containing protein [Propionispora hippei]
MVLRIMAWMRVLVIGALVMAAGGYALYNSDWFQKKFVYPFPYQDIVYKYALKNNVDPFLVAAVIRSESKFFAKARSHKGAMGLMQMMPETADWVAQQIDAQDFSVTQLEQPEVSIRLGTWYLASLQKEFGNNEYLMLAAYNGGRGNVKQWMAEQQWPPDFNRIEAIPFRETREYVKKTLDSKARYQALYKD